MFKQLLNIFVLFCSITLLNGRLMASSNKDSLNQYKSVAGIGTSLSFNSFINYQRYFELKSFYGIKKDFRFNLDLGYHSHKYEAIQEYDEWENKLIPARYTHTKGYFINFGLSKFFTLNKRLSSVFQVGVLQSNFIQNDYTLDTTKTDYSIEINSTILHVSPSIDFKINKHFHLQGGIRVPILRAISYKIPDSKSHEVFNNYPLSYPIQKITDGILLEHIHLSLFYQFKY